MNSPEDFFKTLVPTVMERLRKACPQDPDSLNDTLSAIVFDVIRSPTWDEVRPLMPVLREGFSELEFSFGPEELTTAYDKRGELGLFARALATALESELGDQLYGQFGWDLAENEVAWNTALADFEPICPKRWTREVVQEKATLAMTETLPALVEKAVDALLESFNHVVAENPTADWKLLQSYMDDELTNSVYSLLRREGAFSDTSVLEALLDAAGECDAFEHIPMPEITDESAMHGLEYPRHGCSRFDALLIKYGIPEVMAAQVREKVEPSADFQAFIEAMPPVLEHQDIELRTRVPFTRTGEGRVILSSLLDTGHSLHFEVSESGPSAAVRVEDKSGRLIHTRTQPVGSLLEGFFAGYELLTTATEASLDVKERESKAAAKDRGGR